MAYSWMKDYIYSMSQFDKVWAKWAWNWHEYTTLEKVFGIWNWNKTFIVCWCLFFCHCIFCLHYQRNSTSGRCNAVCHCVRLVRLLLCCLKYCSTYHIACCHATIVFCKQYIMKIMLHCDFCLVHCSFEVPNVLLLIIIVLLFWDNTVYHLMWLQFSVQRI